MTENLKDDSRIVELMAKQLGKSASVDELQELERLVAANPAYGWLSEVVGSLKGSPEHVERNLPAEELADSGWKHLSDRLKADLQRRPGAPRIWVRVAVAAAVILAIGAFTVLYLRGITLSSTDSHADKTTNVRNGSRKKIILSDGSTVWLNAGSRLSYPEVFKGPSREVTLEGEAFFDVAHADAPFLVHAGKLMIRVLGTSFDVKAYREDAAISTTLITGKVQVTMDDDPEKKIVLAPNEKLTVMNTPTAAVANPGKTSGNALRYLVQDLPRRDTLPETAWVENRLVFSNEAFEDVARTLQRRFDVEIDFSDGRLRQEHLSGIFERETLPQVLDILQMTTRFRYRIEGKKVRLMPDPQQ